MNFYQQKLLNAILYFVKAREPQKTTVTAIDLFLFQFDFGHFQRTGIPAIGLHYAAFDYGPFPVDFRNAIHNHGLPEDFTESLNITETLIADSERPRIDFRTTSHPDLDVFSPCELDILEEIAGAYRTMTAKQMVDIVTAEGTPWKKTVETKGMGSEIDYLTCLEVGSVISPEVAADSLNEFFAVLHNFQIGAFVK